MDSILKIINYQPYLSSFLGNRNYDFHWLESGASYFSCSQSYAGMFNNFKKRINFIFTLIHY